MAARSPHLLVMGGLILTSLGAIGLKLALFDYSLNDVLPRTRYDVTLRASYDGHDGETRVRTLLPTSDMRQQIVEEENLTPSPTTFSSEAVGLNRVATWQQNDARLRRQGEFGNCTAREATQVP